MLTNKVRCWYAASIPRTTLPSKAVREYLGILLDVYSEAQDRPLLRAEFCLVELHRLPDSLEGPLSVFKAMYLHLVAFKGFIGLEKVLDFLKGVRIKVFEVFSILPALVF